MILRAKAWGAIGSTATGKRGGCADVLDKEKSRQISIDLIIGKGAAELSAQIASGPVVHPQQRWRRRIKSCGRREPAQIGSPCGTMLNAAAAIAIANGIFVTPRSPRQALNAR